MASLSAFERLPAEIRHMIYAELGFPVAGRQWVQCPGRYSTSSCDYKSHFILGEHVPEGDVLIWRKIDQFVFGSVISPFQYQIPAEFTWEGSSGYTSTDFEKGLLGANKAIRDELLDLLFGCIPVRFEWPMGIEFTLQRPIYRHRSTWYPPPPSDLEWRTCQPDVPMSFMPSTLAYMTSIEFDGWYDEDQDIVLHTGTVKFVAEHCPHLLRFTYMTSFDALKNSNIEQILHLALACQDLTVSCKKLKELRFLRSTVDRRESRACLLEDEFVTEELGEGGWDRVAVWSWGILSKVLAKKDVVV